MTTGFLVKSFLLLSLSLIFLLPSCLALSVSVSAVDNGQFFPGGRLLFNIQREADDETVVDILLSNGSNGNRTLIFGSVDLTQPSQSNAGFTIPDVAAGRSYTLRLVRSSNKQFLVDSSPFEIVATPSTSSSSSATSTPSNTPSNTPSDKTKKEVPLGAIIGGVLGGLGGILLGAIIAVLCWRKRSRQQRLDSPTSVETDNEKGHKTTLNIPFVNTLKRAQSKSSSVDHTVLPYHVPPPPLRPSTPPPNPLAPLRVDTTGNPPATSSTTTFAPSSVSTSNIKSKILRERDFLSGTLSSSIPSPSSGPSSTTRASSSIVAAHASPVDSTPGSSFAVAGSPGGISTGPSTATGAGLGGPTSADNTAQRAEYLRMERDRINQEIARLEGRSTFSGSVLTTSTNPSSIGYTSASGSHSVGGSVDESASVETRNQLAALREQVRRLEMSHRQTVSTFDDFSEPPPEYYRDSQPPPPLPLPNAAAGMSQPVSPPVDSKSGL